MSNGKIFDPIQSRPRLFVKRKLLRERCYKNHEL